MDYNLKNFSEESRQIIIKAKTLSKECGYGVIEPEVLFVALYNLERTLCNEIFHLMHVDTNDFLSRIGLCLQNIAHIPNDEQYFSRSSTLVLLKSSYIALQNDVYSTYPEFILQALIEECNSIKDTLHRLHNNISVSHAVASYRQSHPRSLSSVTELIFRPDLMQGWGYDVANDNNLTEYEQGYLIHALEEYCQSDYTREFSLGEKRLIAKLRENNYHIGMLVRNIKEELNLNSNI